MTIKKLSHNTVITAQYNTSLYDIAHLMKKYNIGDVIIVDDPNKNIPVGVITDRDIVIKAIADEVNLKEIVASDLMSDDLLLLKEHQGVMECLEMMCAKGVRRAPVTNSAGTLTGIVSTDDLILLIADEMESYAKLIRKQLADRRLYSF